METADISRLASDLEANPSRDSPLLLPSLQQLYRLGLVLVRILQQNDPKQIHDNSVVAAYRELIESIPDESLSSLFGDLQTASQRLLQSNKNPQDLILAVRSMEGLIGVFSDSDSSSCRETESTSRLCRVIYQSAWVSTLAALYDRFIVFEKQQQNNNNNMEELELTKAGILSCLSRLVLDGLVLAGNEVVEESLLDAIRAMEEESTDCLRDLQAWQNREEPFRRNLQDSVLAIDNNNKNASNADEDEALERAQQREYIVSMLESARAEPSSMAVPRSEVKPRSNQTANTNTTTANTNVNKNTSELDRRIQQVLQILPHFGEGFVEVALGLHQGDVESTVATLLNHHDASSSADYPTALKVLDPKLPRRKREFRAYQTAEEEAHSAMEARRDVKERMALEEKQKQDQYEALVVASSAASQQQQQQQQQKEAEQVSKDASAATPLPDKKLTRKELRQQKLRQMRIRDEYDDDYDDQYDEIDIKLGAADDGFTSDNMTFEQVKLYNQVVQEDESDAAFWESNRNTNQKASKNSGEKKWGPDKIRGGRVIDADGKIVRKPGGVKKKKTNNRNNNSGQNNSNNNGSNNNNNNNKGGKPKANNSSNNNNNNNNNGNNNGNSAANNGNKKKPKTKPRSDNRVNRQRDRKMKKQGAFGVQD